MVPGVKPPGSFGNSQVELPPRPGLSVADTLPSIALPFTIPEIVDRAVISMPWRHAPSDAKRIIPIPINNNRSGKKL